MSNIQQVNFKMTPEEAMAKIEDYTRKTSEEALSFVQDITIEDYKNFLDTMYHYTRNTGDKAREAAESVKPEELKEFFMHFVDEEHWHYKLAVSDLKAFGLKPSENQPQAVADFDAYWASLKNKHHNAYLGALYVFENIAKYTGSAVRDIVESLNLQKDQSRWILIHAEADLEHGEEVAEILQKYLPENPEAAVESAQIAGELWAGVMRAAFQKLPKAA